MSDIIRLLPDSVANQIAAGEVIQRPASVIKELVENSVDAKAHVISIILIDAGRTLIQVIDDGIGMSDMDARMAFERHATSKIQSAADLFTLRTMGFRGEALPSIAAISQLDVRSQQHDATLGTRLLINGSKVESQVPESCSPGTNIMVKNLFFNVPARRKFLKKDSVELNNILKEFERLALVNPGVELNITHNNTLLHNLRRASFKQRIIDLFGKSLEKQLISVDASTSIIRINGYITLPENARRRNPLQYLMVNGRNMRHPYFHKAIMLCYQGLIPQDAQPSYFLNFEVDPDSIDVNIHPTKNEIKFENEQAIWQILTAAVRESLGRFNGTPGMDFEQVDMLNIPAFEPNAAAMPQTHVDPGYNPFETNRSTPKPAQHFKDHVDKNWEALYASYKTPNQDDTPVMTSRLNDLPPQIPMEYEPGTGEAIQLSGRYLLTPARDGLMIVDQHRAHSLVLYNDYYKQIKEQKVTTQRSIFPDLLELTASQNAVMDMIAPLLPQAGFEITNLGQGKWEITGTPALMTGASPVVLLTQMIDNVINTGEDPLDKIYERIARIMAEKCAIPYDHALNQQEIQALLSQLLSLPAPGYTIDGKRVIAILSQGRISDMLN